MTINGLMKEIQTDADLYLGNDLFFKRDDIHSSVWNSRLGEQPLLDSKGMVNQGVIENFRKNLLLVSDNPQIDLSSSEGDPLVRAEEARLLQNLVSIFKKYDFTSYLRKYPSPDTGNPYLYKYNLNGARVQFTHRWFKHLYSLALFDKYLYPRLGKKFTTIDIGSSYGIFQYLLHKEHKGCSQVLVDFPEQLLLARYFLQSNFPEASIAGVEEISRLSTVSRDFIEKYDFVLLPWQWYEKLESGAADLVSSFACLGELKKELFDYYVDRPVFKSASYYYLVNPVSPVKGSVASGDSDISILEYPFINSESKIMFGISPVYIFGYSYNRFQPFFEYIGLNSNR